MQRETKSNLKKIIIKVARTNLGSQEQRGEEEACDLKSRNCSVRLRGSLCLPLSQSPSLFLSLPLSVFFFFFYRECILSESIKTAPGSSVLADSCGATQLKEVLVSSAPRGRSLALARRGQAP